MVNHTLDDSLLNMPIGLSIGRGMAYRYVLPAAIGGWKCLSIPTSLTGRFWEICSKGYSSWDRHVKLSIDTYLFDQYLRDSRAIVIRIGIDFVHRYLFFFTNLSKHVAFVICFSLSIRPEKLVQSPTILRIGMWFCRSIATYLNNMLR